MKYLTPEQVNYIQGHLKIRGENTVTLAARLERPWSTVAGTINGNRANPEVRQAIADFLGKTVEELFGESIRTAGEGACGTPAGSQDEVSHG